MDRNEKESWASPDPYEQYVGRWSRAVARVFFQWLAIPPGQVWGDVGCGTGALVKGMLAEGQPSAVYAIDRSIGFLAGARRRINDQRVHFGAADAAALPWANRACDVTVSGLVLNFVPDMLAMAREMVRVTRPKGQVAVYVWDYQDKMEMMRYFWDAAIQVDPQASALDEGPRFAICQPEPLRNLFLDAGLSSVAVRAIDIPTTFRNFDDYWLPFLGAQGSAPTYLASVDNEKRDQIQAVLKARLPATTQGSIQLIARAWAVRGDV